MISFAGLRRTAIFVVTLLAALALWAAPASAVAPPKVMAALGDSITRAFNSDGPGLSDWPARSTAPRTPGRLGPTRRSTASSSASRRSTPDAIPSPSTTPSPAPGRVPTGRSTCQPGADRRHAGPGLRDHRDRRQRRLPPHDRRSDADGDLPQPRRDGAQHARNGGPQGLHRDAEHPGHQPAVHDLHQSVPDPNAFLRWSAFQRLPGAAREPALDRTGRRGRAGPRSANR